MRRRTRRSEATLSLPTSSLFLVIPWMLNPPSQRSRWQSLPIAENRRTPHTCTYGPTARWHSARPPHRGCQEAQQHLLPTFPKSEALSLPSPFAHASNEVQRQLSARFPTSGGPSRLCSLLRPWASLGAPTRRLWLATTTESGAVVVEPLLMKPRTRRKGMRGAPLRETLELIVHSSVGHRSEESSLYPTSPSPSASTAGNSFQPILRTCDALSATSVSAAAVHPPPWTMKATLRQMKLHLAPTPDLRNKKGGSEKGANAFILHTSSATESSLRPFAKLAPFHSLLSGRNPLTVRNRNYNLN
jgi:hypothetical protein